MAEYFPEGLLSEILCRLPIKSLIMFKCVIRSWNSLISNVCIPRISCMPFPDSGFFCKFSPDEPRMDLKPLFKNLTLHLFFQFSLSITITYFSLPCRSRRRLCRCLVQTNHRRLCRVTPPLVLAGRVPSSPLSQLGLYVAAGPLIIYQLKIGIEDNIMVEHFSEDLLSDILCRLPIKSLIMFKCVSRSWNSLISNVCIPRISRMPLPLSGFFCKFSPRESRMEYVSYSDEVITDNNVNCDSFVESYSSLLPSKYSPYHLVDCCNGIILLVSISVCRYYLCNPAIKQCVAIPKAHAHTDVKHAVLAFNPHESSHYKVICLHYTDSCCASNPPELDIFSSETRKWIRYAVPVEPPVVYGVAWIKRNVYLDGMLYKLTESKHLLVFDLKSLTARAIELPDKDEPDANGFIGVSKGVFHYANNDGSSFMFWQLDYHSKAGCFWILKYSICIHGLIDRHPNAERLYEFSNLVMCKPYAIHPNLDIVFLGIPRMIFSYDLKTNKLELIWTRPFERPLMWGQYFFYTYSRCFIMLDDFSKRHHESSQLETIMEGTNGVELETVSDDRD
ncbi:hypothetical protein ACOSQ4_024030 [Xanthoceras sorbifolium]